MGAENDQPSKPSIERDRASAEFAAHVQASAEDLPIIKGTVFAHWQFGTVDPREQAYLKTARMLGDPEQDDELTMQMRAELVDAVTRLRTLLNTKSVSQRDVKRSLETRFKPSQSV